MNRRGFVRTIGGGATVLGAGSASQPVSKGKADRVVVIMTDTTRADMLNCYRNTGLKTPNLDRMASQGVRFDRAHTCQPVCAPARSSLFTGLSPHSTGVWGNSMPLGQTVRTIGRRLTDRGVHCAYIGKWHLTGADYFDTGRCPEGWDRRFWYDGRNYLDELSDADKVRSRDQNTNRDPNLKEDFLYGHRCSNRAVDFLSRFGRDRFFLTVSYDEPHGPSLCPRPYAEMYRDFVFPLSENCSDTLEHKPEHQRVWAGKRLTATPKPASRPDYFGCHTYVDYEIGRVLDAINQYAPDSLVIYTADHGDFLGSHRLDNKGPAMYEEITRIPMLVQWPGHAPPNAVCPHPASHIDFVPTILDAFGLKAPRSLEGRSMLRTFEDPTIRPNDAIFMEFGRYEVDHDGFGAFQPIRSVYDGRYKLTVNLLTTDELYDLEADPGEMSNLIDSQETASVRNNLHDRLIDWMNRTRDPFRGYYWERRPWRPNQLVSWEGAGMTRQREDDGYEPRQLVYETGLEMKNAVRKK